MNDKQKEMTPKELIKWLNDQVEQLSEELRLAHKSIKYKDMLIAIYREDQEESPHQPTRAKTGQIYPIGQPLHKAE